LLHFKCAEEAAGAADGTGLMELGAPADEDEDEDEHVFFTILAQDIG
jgi:hypothetical protein